MSWWAALRSWASLERIAAHCYTRRGMSGTIGLIAGNGKLPVLAAKGIREAGHRVVCVVLTRQFDPLLPALCDHFRFASMRRVGQWIRLLRRWGAARASMVGHVRKSTMYDPISMFQALPDFCGVRLWFKELRHDRRSNNLLRVIAGEFHRRGIEVIGATQFMPQIMADEGVMTRTQPNGEFDVMVRTGAWQLRRLGELDIGQAIAVAGDRIVAAEAMEGTDALIRRAGLLCRGRPWMVMKAAKPGQDMRFDVPTVGLRTIANLKAAGASCLAVAARSVIMLDKRRLIEAADDAGIAVVGVSV